MGSESIGHGYSTVLLAVALCTPSLLGTLGIALVSAGLSERFRMPLIASLAPWFFALALYGPLALILAAVIVVKLSRAEGASFVSVVGWIVFTLSLVATAAFHWTLIESVPLP